MAEDTAIRKLAAVLSADVVGYSRLMERDEEATLAEFKAIRAEIIDPGFPSDPKGHCNGIGDGPRP